MENFGFTFGAFLGFCLGAVVTSLVWLALDIIVWPRKTKYPAMRVEATQGTPPTVRQPGFFVGMLTGETWSIPKPRPKAKEF